MSQCLQNNGKSGLPSTTTCDRLPIDLETPQGTTFIYDAIGQLLSESRSGYSCAYTYDANGNRLTKTLGGSTENYTYDAADKLTSAGSKTYSGDYVRRSLDQLQL